MKPIVKRTKTYQWLAIAIFFATGAGSVYVFYQVPSLPFLQGINDYAFRSVVSLAWVLMFPFWMALFFAAMALLEIFLNRHDI